MLARPTATAPTKVADKAIHAQLSRIVGSKTFGPVGRLKRFITFIVEETLGGRGHELKEFVIGVQVFGKETSFDPRTDPIVRVQARRLRARLTRYFREEGQEDPILIDLPKGGYSPVFRRRVATPAARTTVGAALARRNTVAIGRFVDHSPTGSLAFFAGGLRDEIVHALTAIKAVRVMARAIDDDEGRRGTAALVIEGSVRQSGDAVRVTVRVLDGAGGHYLWSESTDVSNAESVAGQERIATRVAMYLQSAAIDSESEGARRPNDNLAARNLYLQGRYHLNQRTEEGLQKAVEFFEKAVSEDSQFSLAHSGLADAWGLLAHYGVLGPANVWARAASSATTAVMLDRHSSEAHTSLAHVKATQDWDWPAAELEFQHALQLNARYSTAHHWYALSCLVPQGRIDVAMEHIRVAQALDPVSSIIARDVAVMCCYRRDFDAALEHCDQTIELNPHFAPAYLTLGLIQELRRDFDEAEAAYRRATNLAPSSVRMQAALARTYALAGRTDQARSALKRIEQLAASRYVSPFAYVGVHFALGDDRKGFSWLNKACDDRCFELLALRVDPRFEPLQADERMQAVIARVGLV